MSLKQLKIPLEEIVLQKNCKSLSKSLVYVSEAIEDISVFENSLSLTIDTSMEDLQSVKRKVYKMIKRFLNHEINQEKMEVFKHTNPNIKYVENIINQLEEKSLIYLLSEGQYSYRGIFLKLLQFFDHYIQKIGIDIGAEEYSYPNLIPINTLQRIQFLSARPESLNYVSHLREDIDQIDDFSIQAKSCQDEIVVDGRFKTDMVSSSAVCFHAYHALQEQELKTESMIINSVGKCLRYESKKMDLFYYLREFTMREVIVLGTKTKIEEFLLYGIEQMKRLLSELDLNGTIRVANDPFFIDEFGHQAMFQKVFKLKYEIQANLSDNNELAIGSLNNHKDYLGQAFNIRYCSIPIHSACLAFGLERCVHAFLAQYGLDQANWPDIVLQGLQKIESMKW